ncbi:MAG TPA: sugar phosphate nucleotidyltransferase, partial [Spirochaetia bacterium]|nr:sugar phosphate nucleotidyltransferase [Spirochaetia bacterium]
FGDRSLLQMSFDRLEGLVPPDHILVLTNLDFVQLVREQLPELPAENVLGEPYRRDTAAAVCLATLLAERRFGNPVIATLTADHLIEPIEGFQRVLLSAADNAGSLPVLYTFGVKPTYPSTAYGYLETGELLSDTDGISHYRLRSFKEKPDYETAADYVESGGYLWNSGMFVWQTSTIRAELERNLPDHVKQISKAIESDGKEGFHDALARAFEPLSSISIDFAVMEKSKGVCCVAADFNWSDVGGWLALADHLPKDSAGNHIHAELHQLDSRDNLVYSEDASEKVMLVGVEGLIVVHSGDRILVTRKERAEEIKKVVKEYGLE